MIYNMDFLISAMIILLLILWHFLGQKRAEDLNNRVFLFFAVLGTADVVAEFFTNYYITSYNSDMGTAAVIVTTIFYLLQALLPATFIFYIQTLHEQKIISAKKMFISGVPTLVLISVILTNPFTEKLFSFDVLILSLICVMFVNTVLYTHMLMDYDGDKNANKTTLCLKLGSKQKALNLLLIFYAFSYILLIPFAIKTNNYLYFITYITIPLVFDL